MKAIIIFFYLLFFSCHIYWMCKPCKIKKEAESCPSLPLSEKDNLSATRNSSPYSSIDSNDILLRNDFTEKLHQLLKRQEMVRASELRKQLRRQEKYSLILPTTHSSQKFTPAELYQRYKDNLLIIGTLYQCSSPQCEKWHTKISSGFLLTESGIAITNYHVIDGTAEDVSIGARTSNGEVFAIEKILASHEAEDLALIQLKGNTSAFKSIPLGFDEMVGAPVTVISHPNGRFYTLTEGILSRHYTDEFDGIEISRFSITADFASGSSGAPVLNQYGEVIGVVCSTFSVYDYKEKNIRNLQMVVKSCVPSNSILKLLKKTQ